MTHIKMPVKKQKHEIRWQALDAAAILAVACSVTALLVHDLVISAGLFAFSLTAVVLYLLIELKLERRYDSYGHLKPHHHSLAGESRTNVLLWGVIIGTLAVGNFLLFFTRHGVTASTVPATAPLYKEAVVLMFLTITLCLIARTLHHRVHVSRHLNLTGLHYARHMKLYVLAVVYTVALIIAVATVTPYHADFGFALLAVLLFIAVREFQRYDRKQHRSHLLQLHRSVNK